METGGRWSSVTAFAFAPPAHWPTWSRTFTSGFRRPRCPRRERWPCWCTTAAWSIVKHAHPALLGAQAGLCLLFCKLEWLLCFLYLHISCACQTSCLSSLVNYWITFHPLTCIIFPLCQGKKNFAALLVQFSRPLECIVSLPTDTRCTSETLYMFTAHRASLLKD